MRVFSETHCVIMTTFEFRCFASKFDATTSRIKQPWEFSKISYTSYWQGMKKRYIWRHTNAELMARFEKPAFHRLVSIQHLDHYRMKLKKTSTIWIGLTDIKFGVNIHSDKCYMSQCPDISWKPNFRPSFWRLEDPNCVVSLTKNINSN